MRDNTPLPPVLVVEDEAMIRMLLVDVLEEAGHAVIEAETADEAVVLLTDGLQIRAVVTDVRMPGRLDGLGLAEWLRAHRPGIPIVVTSGYATPSNALRVNPAITAFVGKPYSPEQIPRLLQQVLAR